MNSNRKFVGLMSQEEEAEKLQNTLINGARREGIIEGIKQKEIEIAKNMLNKNMDIETISEVTGLTKEEIKTLK